MLLIIFMQWAFTVSVAASIAVHCCQFFYPFPPFFRPKPPQVLPLSKNYFQLGIAPYTCVLQVTGAIDGLCRFRGVAGLHGYARSINRNGAEFPAEFVAHFVAYFHLAN